MKMYSVMARKLAVNIFYTKATLEKYKKRAKSAILWRQIR